MAILDPEGKVVATPVDEVAIASGNHSAVWNMKGISNGAYTVAITAEDSSQNTSMVTSKITVEKVVTPVLNISKVSAKADYSTEKAKIAYKLSDKAKVTVTVKNSKGKVIATPVKQKWLNKGKSCSILEL